MTRKIAVSLEAVHTHTHTHDIFRKINNKEKVNSKIEYKDSNSLKIF